MLGRSLKSESPEGPSPEAKSRRVQQSDQIQEGQESSAECPERLQIWESHIQSSIHFK